MGSILDRATAHYSGIGMRHVDVPEWGDAGKPLRIFFSPLTIGERNKIYARDDNGAEPLPGTVCVNAVLLKAVDEKGKKLFDPFEDREVLLHAVDSAVVGRIAAKILGGSKGEPTDQMDGAKND